MGSFAPAFSLLRLFEIDVDSDARAACDADDEPPATVRSPGFTPHPTMRVGLYSIEEAEPETIRGEEIRAAAPRLERTFDPADYVVEDAPAPSGVMGPVRSRVRRRTRAA